MKRIIVVLILVALLALSADVVLADKPTGFDNNGNATGQTGQIDWVSIRPGTTEWRGSFSAGTPCMFVWCMGTKVGSLAWGVRANYGTMVF